MKAGFLNLANQRRSGFFSQQRFGGGIGCNTDKQREQRAVITATTRGFVPGFGDGAVMVVNFAGNVFNPKVAAEQGRRLVVAVFGEKFSGGAGVFKNFW